MHEISATAKAADRTDRLRRLQTLFLDDALEEAEGRTNDLPPGNAHAL